MTITILFITPAPDRRDSTSNLARLVAEADARAGCRAELWYLRCSPEHTPIAGTRTVDRLRTWLPARSLDLVGLRGIAAGLRGARLRRWLRRIEPTVVVLDDGLGSRVLTNLTPRPAVVVRRNPIPPEHLHLEPPPESDPDLWMIPAGVTPPADGRPCTVEYPFRDSPAPRYADPEARRRVRRSLDLPADGPLVVGWGGDGWLDGSDLFVRGLWALRHRHALDAHGVWFDLGTDTAEAQRLLAEARRCGVEDRFHLRRAPEPSTHLCGDAVLLPYRSDARVDEVLDAAFSGAVAVVFEAASIDHPLVTSVRDLDVDAAAAAIADGLANVDRATRAESVRRWFSPGPIVDDLVALARRR